MGARSELNFESKVPNPKWLGGGQLRTIAVIVLIAGAIYCWPQETGALNSYLRQQIGLRDDQIRALNSGKAVSKTLPSRTPAEIFVFGAVYINAPPDAYVKLSTDIDRLAKMAHYTAFGTFSTPPQLTDLEGFTFDSDEISSLRKCFPGKCQIQLPGSAIADFQQTIDWSAPNAEEQVNQLVQKRALRRVNAYLQAGNAALGEYNDKGKPADIAGQFQDILSYSAALPDWLPAFYPYLLSYPLQKPANVDERFYWAKMNFGLKPTLRIVHVVVMRGKIAGYPVNAIAEKQIYASHYFQTALDLAFCLSSTPDADKPGFYLIQIMASEQADLTGAKGSVIRMVAEDRLPTPLQKWLTEIKNALEDTR